MITLAGVESAGGARSGQFAELVNWKEGRTDADAP